MFRASLIAPSAAALLVSLAVTNEASAQSPPADSSPATQAQGGLDRTAASLPTFEALDRNRDDYVSRDEVPATHELAGVFVSLDGNQDNKLERGEFAKYNPASRQPY